MQYKNIDAELMLSVQQAHERLGHINGRMTKDIAKSFRWKLDGNQTLNCAALIQFPPEMDEN